MREQLRVLERLAGSSSDDIGGRTDVKSKCHFSPKIVIKSPKNEDRTSSACSRKKSDPRSCIRQLASIGTIDRSDAIINASSAGTTTASAVARTLAAGKENCIVGSNATVATNPHRNTVNILHAGLPQKMWGSPAEAVKASLERFERVSICLDENF